jgi:ketosteroid isomerase-like protein
MTTTTLTGVIAEYIRAVNAFDTDAVMNTFAEGAMVNDVSREFWGSEHIRAWVAKEMVGDHVTIDVTEVVEFAGQTIVRGAFDGDYPKDGLPDPLILNSYFTIQDEKIVALIIMQHKHPDY